MGGTLSLFGGAHTVFMGAASTPAKSSGSSYTLLILLALFGLFYFFVIRPRSQKQRTARDQVKKAGLGDEIQTIGGLIGTIVAEDGDRVTVSTGNGIELTFVRQAIGKKIEPPAPMEPDVADEGGEPGSS
jgi:preprotein translocase subunit YajC